MSSESYTSTSEIGAYLREMRKHPLLDPEQEAHLAGRMRQARRHLQRLPAASRRSRRQRHWRRRYEDARNAFMLGHLRLVVHIARGYLNQGLPLIDLIQEGNLGLMRAVEKYDPERGNRFSTYAYWWIQQALQRAIASKASLIRLPLHQRLGRQQVARVSGMIARKTGREPSPGEIARRLRIPVAKVEEALAPVPEPRSLDRRGADDGPDPLDLLADPRAASPLEEAGLRELHDGIADTLRRLSPRDAELMRLRFGIGGARPHTLAEVGRRLKLSRERVRQIEAGALRRLRASARLRALYASARAS